MTKLIQHENSLYKKQPENTIYIYRVRFRFRFNVPDTLKKLNTIVVAAFQSIYSFHIAYKITGYVRKLMEQQYII